MPFKRSEDGNLFYCRLPETAEAASELHLLGERKRYLSMGSGINSGLSNSLISLGLKSAMIQGSEIA